MIRTRPFRFPKKKPKFKSREKLRSFLNMRFMCVCRASDCSGHLTLYSNISKTRNCIKKLCMSFSKRKQRMRIERELRRRGKQSNWSIPSSCQRGDIEGDPHLLQSHLKGRGKGSTDY